MKSHLYHRTRRLLRTPIRRPPRNPRRPHRRQVRVRAAALNRLDVYTRAGVRGTRIRNLDGPHVLGGDAAGEIVEVGSAVRGREAGQRRSSQPANGLRPVPPLLSRNRRVLRKLRDARIVPQRQLREFVSVPATSAVPIPDSLSYEEAATLPTVYLPSWTILVRKGALQSWETALILSASAGVGTAGIQVARTSSAPPSSPPPAPTKKPPKPPS